MASDKSFVEFIADQAGDAGDVTFRKMFGDYALYCNDKVVALICEEGRTKEEPVMMRGEEGCALHSPAACRVAITLHTPAASARWSNILCPALFK